MRLQTPHGCVASGRAKRGVFTNQPVDCQRTAEALVRAEASSPGFTSMLPMWPLLWLHCRPRRFTPRRSKLTTRMPLSTATAPRASSSFSRPVAHALSNHPRSTRPYSPSQRVLSPGAAVLCVDRRGPTSSLSGEASHRGRRDDDFAEAGLVQGPALPPEPAHSPPRTPLALLLPLTVSRRPSSSTDESRAGTVKGAPSRPLKG